MEGTRPVLFIDIPISIRSAHSFHAEHSIQHTWTSRAPVAHGSLRFPFQTAHCPPPAAGNNAVVSSAAPRNFALYTQDCNTRPLAAFQLLLCVVNENPQPSGRLGAPWVRSLAGDHLHRSASSPEMGGVSTAPSLRRQRRNGATLCSMPSSVLAESGSLLAVAVERWHVEPRVMVAVHGSWRGASPGTRPH